MKIGLRGNNIFFLFITADKIPNRSSVCILRGGSHSCDIGGKFSSDVLFIFFIFFLSNFFSWIFAKWCNKKHPWDTGNLRSVGVHYITWSHTEFKVLYISLLLNQQRQAHPRQKKQNLGCLSCSWKYENKSSECVFILESENKPIVALLLYVRPGAKENIYIHPKKNRKVWSS